MILSSSYSFNAFDIVYIVIIILAILIGIHKGFLKSIGGLGAFAIAVVAGFLLAKPLGNAIMGWSIGKNMHQSFYDFIVKAFSDAATALNAEAIKTALPTLYSKINLPSFLQDAFTNIVSTFLPTGEDTVALAEPVAAAATEIACVCIAFVAVFLLVLIVYWILLIVSKAIHKTTDTKPNPLSKLLGAIIKLAEGLAIIYICSFIFTMCSSMQNGFGTWVNEFFALNDNTKISLSKWLIQQDWLYSWLTGYLHA